MNALNILDALVSSKPVQTRELPSSFGIYALWDHSGSIRYIGCTPGATEGFDIRVGRKHVAGSEARSHKFSHAYCIGRMWRYCEKLHDAAAGAAQDQTDASQAKHLRNLFIRRNCRVTFVELPPESRGSDYRPYLTALEAEVQALAPPHMRAWEGVRFMPVASEPESAVDELLKEYPALRPAASRQNVIYQKHVLRVRAGTSTTI